jgi:hypothetical protein
MRANICLEKLIESKCLKENKIDDKESFFINEEILDKLVEFEIYL